MSDSHDLVSFVRARFAEDEDLARQADGRDLAVPPVRLLARVRALRGVLDEVTYVRRMERVPTGRPGVYGSAPVWGFHDDADAEQVLRAFAALYDDHPDYREEWRP